MKNYFVHKLADVEKGAVIGRGTKIWRWSHIQAGAIIGKNCTIGQNVFVAKGVIIGNNVKIQNNVSIYTGVIIEDNVFIAPSVVFTNVKYPQAEYPVKPCYYKNTIIKKGTTIGANATVICDIMLGKYCFVAAGAVITKNFPPYSLIKGVPGRNCGVVTLKEIYPL